LWCGFGSRAELTFAARTECAPYWVFCATRVGGSPGRFALPGGTRWPQRVFFCARWGLRCARPGSATPATAER